MRDPRTELWLKKQGVSFTYVDAVGVAEVRGADASLVNVRLTDQLNDDWVLRYAISLEDGDEFPAIITYKARDGYRLIAGHHRLAAFALAKRSSIDMYLVDTDDEAIIRRLRRTENLTGSFGTPMSEALIHGVQFVQEGHSIRDAARMAKVHEKTLGEKVISQRVQVDLIRLGVRVEDLPESTARNMHGLRGRFLKAVADLAIGSRLPADTVREYAKAIKDADDDGARDGLIATWTEVHADDRARTAGGRIQPPAAPLRRLPAVLKQVERLIGGPDEVTKALAPRELAALIDLTRRMILRLQTWLSKLEDYHAALDRRR